MPRYLQGRVGGSQSEASSEQKHETLSERN
jgi:hypothetical protein